MKKTLFISLFISFKIFGQAVTIVPSSVNNTEFLKIKKNGVGLDHRATDGVIGVGTYSGGYIQTHTPHSLLFTTNNGGPYMTLSYSTTPTLNGNLGIGILAPQEKLHVFGNIRASGLAGSGNLNVQADANGTLKTISPVAFSAYLNSALPIPPNTNTTIGINAEKYDLSNNFNTTTNLFTAPTNGIYHFDALVTWSSATATGGSFILEIIGSSPLFTLTQTTYSIPTTNYTFISSTASVDVKLNAGQTVKLSAYQTSNVTLTIQGNYNDYFGIFSGHLITAL
ncbi:hypothetical protein GCM10011514_02710 [Emticicia aquatilis]|uniref:C1q domain-containing protein n=1 Tax=Emticicia aquatilis TaxID=1537369 RepID=A0A916YEM8_9BACT|nr:hypothetical protein [Emticicia aquatilis]GGD42193.1 hypothetical protein GCM10011514_02710 [Emticicia aquatilis]